MNFGKILQIVTALPTLIQTVESVRGSKNGAVKQAEVRDAVLGTASTMQVLGQLQVLDQRKFKAGLDQVIDGIVKMLNASAWKK